MDTIICIKRWINRDKRRCNPQFEIFQSIVGFSQAQNKFGLRWKCRNFFLFSWLAFFVDILILFDYSQLNSFCCSMSTVVYNTNELSQNVPVNITYFHSNPNIYHINIYIIASQRDVVCIFIFSYFENIYPN